MTGTVMKSHVKAATKLLDDRTLMGQGWGASDSVVREYGKMVLVKCCDNKPVLMTPSVHNVQPRVNCRRWSKADKAQNEVPKPAAV